MMATPAREEDEMPRTVAFILAVAALMAASSAYAQQASTSGPAGTAPSPGTTVGTVVVQGHRRPVLPPHAPDIVWKDVKVRAQPAHTGNLSRWMNAVCPGVFGLTPPYARFVAKRIAEVTGEFTPPRPRCGRGINVLVAFTTTPQALMNDVRDHHPELLGYHYLIEEKKLATFQGPVEAWYITATDGVVDNANGRQIRVGGVAPGIPTGRLRNGATNSVVFVLVVIDGKSVENEPIGPVADHIAALVLSKTGPRKGCNPFPSILDALDSTCPDSASLTTLSAYDRSFLKALYSSDPEEVGQAERGAVRRSVLKDLRGQPSAETAVKNTPGPVNDKGPSAPTPADGPAGAAAPPR